MLKKTLCALCVLGFVSACSTTPVEQEDNVSFVTEENFLVAEEVTEGQEVLNTTTKDKTVKEMVEEYRIEKQAKLDEEMAEFKQNSFDKALNRYTKDKKSEMDDEIEEYKQQRLDEVEEMINQYAEEQTKLANEKIEGFKLQKAAEFENAVATYKREQLGLSE